MDHHACSSEEIVIQHVLVIQKFRFGIARNLNEIIPRYWKYFKLTPSINLT